jgi:hypothetical protein
MPFGHKPDVGGIVIDFDEVYHELVEPGISQAVTKSVRADEEMSCQVASSTDV